MTFWDGVKWRPEPPRAEQRSHQWRDAAATIVMIVGLAAIAIPLSHSSAAGATINLDPAGAAVGSKVSVGGRNFPAKVTIQIGVDGLADGMPRVQTSGSGTFKASFLVPQIPTGVHVVSAVITLPGEQALGLRSGTVLATVTLTVTEPPPTPAPSLAAAPPVTPTPMGTPAETALPSVATPAPRPPSTPAAASTIPAISPEATPSAPSIVAETPAPEGWTATRLASPTRTEIRDGAGNFIAEFTDGARTVSLTGPVRTWREPGVSASVTTNRWVRLMPAQYGGEFGLPERTWLATKLADTSPDLLAIAFQYVAQAPAIQWNGLRIAGDADYGPQLADGSRPAGSDFNDYLGIAWTYGSIVDPPEGAEFGSLDCSGYTRMVFGYRTGVPMALTPNGSGLPRRSRDQAGYGVAVAAPQVGDLVFFDASADDGSDIDHVGIYLGLDSGGRRRFISSRRQANGPTMGDVGGASLLEGGGYWAAAFRTARRV